jgi:hypothetical protein
MGVRVDEAGGQGLAVGLDLRLPRHAAEIADRQDPVPLHGHVATEARRARAVEDGGIPDHEVAAQGHGSLLKGQG